MEQTESELLARRLQLMRVINAGRRRFATRRKLWCAEDGPADVPPIFPTETHEVGDLTGIQSVDD